MIFPQYKLIYDCICMMWRNWTHTIARSIHIDSIFFVIIRLLIYFQVNEHKFGQWFIKWIKLWFMKFTNIVVFSTPLHWTDSKFSIRSNQQYSNTNQYSILSIVEYCFVSHLALTFQSDTTHTDNYCVFKSFDRIFFIPYILLMVTYFRFTESQTLWRKTIWIHELKMFGSEWKIVLMC